MCGSNSDKTNPLQFLQTVVLSFIPKEKGPKYLDKRKFLNFLLLSQYVPRVFRIYLSSKELSRTRDKLITGTVWIRGAFNFFLYLLASHVRVNLSYIYFQKHIVSFFFSGFFINTFLKGIWSILVLFLCSKRDSMLAPSLCKKRNWLCKYYSELWWRTKRYPITD